MRVTDALSHPQASVEEVSDSEEARSESQVQYVARICDCLPGGNTVWLQECILALRLVAGAMGCVTWVTIDLNPHLFLTDVLSGLSVYTAQLVFCRRDAR